MQHAIDVHGLHMIECKCDGAGCADCDGAGFLIAITRPKGCAHPECPMGNPQ
jgi:hypothetical protein